MTETYKKARYSNVWVHEIEEERTISFGTLYRGSTLLLSALRDQYQKPSFIIHILASKLTLFQKVT